MWDSDLTIFKKSYLITIIIIIVIIIIPLLLIVTIIFKTIARIFIIAIL